MSSFKRRGPVSQPVPPQGTRLSVYNSQLLTSTGVSSLDGFLGGGLPVGTLWLVKEDQHTRYAQLLLRYFLAQGLAHEHGLFVASADMSPETILQHLPAWTAGSEKAQSADAQSSAAGKSEDDKLTIAWRYQNLRKVDGQSATAVKTSSINSSSNRNATTGGADARPFCHRFDLTKAVEPNLLTTAAAAQHIQTMSTTADLDGTASSMYTQLYKAIAAQIDAGFRPTAAPTSSQSILRIAIQSLASPAWPVDSPQAIYRFLHSLRGLLRYSLATAIVTVPTYLYDAVAADQPSLPASWLRRFEHCADLVIELRSFTAEEQAAISADPATSYHGTLHIQRASAVNALVATAVKYGHPGENLAFRQRRRGLLVETLHLPPEGGVTERRTAPTADNPGRAKSAAIRTGLGCASSGGGKADPLDF